MSQTHLVRDVIQLELFDRPEDAPTYRAPEHQAIIFTGANIVGRGTVSGEPTIDLLLEDETGQKWMAMVKSSHLQNISAAVSGMRARTKGN